MAKKRAVAAPDYDFDWAHGQMREPDMTKMPAMKPVASHPVVGRPVAQVKASVSRSMKGRR